MSRPDDAARDADPIFHAMAERLRRIDAAADDDALDAPTLCRLGAVSPEWLRERVEAGLIDAAAAQVVVGSSASSSSPLHAWRFDALTVHRVRRMARVERDFDAVPELAALVADLQGEIDALRRRLRRSGL